MSQYGRLDYWNERYTKEKDPFDWYQRYMGIQHLMVPSTLSPNKSFPSRDCVRVLVPGCGNSLLMEHMIADGFKHITNIDFSPVVISQMEERYKDRGMVFKLADVTDSIPFPDSSFDLIVCKGTLDAILCSSGATMRARTFVEECSRVLEDEHGVLMVVTYGSQENRMVYFEDEKLWPGGVEVYEVPKPRINSPNVNDKGPSNHYIYICRKGKCEALKDTTENLQLEESEATDTTDSNRAKL